MTHGTEDVLHALPSQEVEETHLVAGTVGAADEIAASSAGQFDELVVAVDETSIDGGNAQGDAAGAEDVLVVQTTDEDHDVFVGVAGGPSRGARAG
mmetsp:Transcript_37682/g.82560  ORF Transcript_37682/g.82560 Transcript_37682/m.82560 type:complete len:96 (-) Transcript_37682:1723-2010(-)